MICLMVCSRIMPELLVSVPASLGSLSVGGDQTSSYSAAPAPWTGCTTQSVPQQQHILLVCSCRLPFTDLSVHYLPSMYGSGQTYVYGKPVDNEDKMETSASVHAIAFKSFFGGFREKKQRSI